MYTVCEGDINKRIYSYNLNATLTPKNELSQIRNISAVPNDLYEGVYISRRFCTICIYLYFTVVQPNVQLGIRELETMTKFIVFYFKCNFVQTKMLCGSVFDLCNGIIFSYYKKHWIKNLDTLV